MWSEVLIAGTERTVPLIERFFDNGLHFFEIMGSLGTLYGNDDPLFCSTILSQLRHNTLLFDCGVRIVECGISYQKSVKSEIRNPNYMGLNLRRRVTRLQLLRELRYRGYR